MKNRKPLALLFWALVYALASLGEMCSGWLKEHAEEQLKGKPRDGDK